MERVDLVQIAESFRRRMLPGGRHEQVVRLMRGDSAVARARRLDKAAMQHRRGNGSIKRVRPALE